MKAKGVACRENTVAELMRRDSVRAANARRFVVRTTDPRQDHAVAERTLDRRFEPGDSDRAWVGDITSMATDEGWLYLAVVLDLGSRKVVGWTKANNLRADLVVRAMGNAIGGRSTAAMITGNFLTLMAWT